ncbi:translocation/assembly module TamB domain-containing protein [Phaeobacter sp. PT47_59]|uniref:translocation/assembly module TamB domain-containing protein n=1 Tax=Phaeobacter sp. PT47_59 TaxID=3029979 RepID=UPI00237FDD29|nr:translocation/assembly module TamB domain-containing protein [Phaeobacter sp. PT47_59]MDE4175502.1 translocation/assembly module TamB domain-containing protein [Phaeobacter sp. PT47_59]
MSRFLTLPRIAGLTASLLLVAGVTPLQAQDSSDSGGLLVDFLEDSLSGDNRYITVTGLTGALSSQAAIEQLTVADDDGIWLMIEGAKLDWNRLALLQGRFSVNTLSAETISLLRRPSPVAGDAALPSPEATPLVLPDLPVAVELGEIRAGRVDLGADLLGQPASLSLKGSLSLADGALHTQLEAARLDRPDDRLNLMAGYASSTRQIDLDLSLTEGADGLMSALLDLPDRPNLTLTAKGNGPISDFSADIALFSNGESRLSGQVVLAGAAQPAGDADAQPEPTGIAFYADLGGNIDPLLQPDYRSFFGPGLRFVTRGQTETGGGVTLDTLVLTTDALRLTGSLASTAQGALSTANIKATITPPAGAAQILLPVPGGATTLAGAEIHAQKTEAGDWSLQGSLRQLTHPDLRLKEARLQGVGTLGDTVDSNGNRDLQGDLSLALEGVEPQDPGLARAIGDSLALTTHLSTAGADALTLTDMTLTGADLRAAGDLAISALASDLTIITQLDAASGDLARFADLAGRPLGGRAEAKVGGALTPLSGAFDIDLTLTGQDLKSGLAQLDTVLPGTTSLVLRAARNETGLRIDQMTLEGAVLTAQASGRLDSRSGQLSLAARLEDLQRLVPEAPGPLEVSADLTRSGDQLSGQAALRGPNSSSAVLNGSVTVDGQAEFTFEAALNDLQRFVPELAGALTATGSARRQDGIWDLNAQATAPAEASATLTGSYSEPRGELDMVATGQLRLEGANPFIKPNLAKGLARFDLAMTGLPTLHNLTGTVTTSGATLALPAAGQRVDEIDAQISLQNARALLNLSAEPGKSGTLRLSGPVALTAPYQADLTILLSDLLMSDHLSYDTRLNGRLGLNGALSGASRLAGRIDVGETNLNLNATGGSVTAAPIPPIQHIGAPAAVQATRARAGLIASAEQGAAAAGRSTTALDVVIDAPGKIFARGRGLRAELGGRIHLQGTTAAPVPSGQIGLIRGSFDILGRRLTLDDGQVTLLGDLTPYLEFRSSAQTEQGSATLEISGPTDAPDIKVTSDPPRPSEEALALLLFGDNIKDLSPLALARLASSALTLSGRGGKTQETLREGTGADDADFGFDGIGAGRLGLGGYLSENLYTDVDVNTRGQSELSLNLDLTDSLSVTGTVDSEGESGVGLFFKRDY